MGHLGTLDPMARGVLPVAAGHATRLIEYITDKSKAYTARMVLGGISDTQDAWGNITWTETNLSPFNFKAEQLNNIVESFTGVIAQIPPMYSAVHHQGRRLYELARQGVTVEVKPRQVEIKSLDIIAISYTEAGLPQVSLQIECSEGTYIRTLCHDIGQKLGTGAYMDDLIRTRSGAFTLDEAVELDTILEKGWQSYLKPLDYPINGFPQIELEEADYIRVINGNIISSLVEYEEGLVRLYYHNRLVSIARCSNVEQGIILKPLKVFK